MKGGSSMKDIKGIIAPGRRFVIGMVHCLPLPGTYGFGGDCEAIYRQAVADAVTLEQCGVDAVIVENMGDTPFAVQLDKAQIASLSVAASKVRDAVSIPVGIDAAFNDYETSLSLAYAIGAQFVRVPVFVDTVEFYGGFIRPCARECMNFRKSLNAQDILVLADIQVKHTNLVLPHVTAERAAKDAEGCFADALIVTGSSIGQETPIEMIARVKKAVKIPVIAGSGVNAHNIKDQLDIADGAIVGSSLKAGGELSNPISAELVSELLAAR